MDRVRVKFASTNLPKQLWGEAILCSTYEINRPSANQDTTPATIWYGKNDLTKLRIFGSQAWHAILPKPSKLEKRTGWV